MKRSPKRKFVVTVGRGVFAKQVHVFDVRTAGAAACRAFRTLIRGKQIKNRPLPNGEGGWEGVSIS